MFLSLIPMHFLPSIHPFACTWKALLGVAQALLDLSFFHSIEFTFFLISSFRINTIPAASSIQKVALISSCCVVLSHYVGWHDFRVK